MLVFFVMCYLLFAICYLFFVVLHACFVVCSEFCYVVIVLVLSFSDV